MAKSARKKVIAHGLSKKQLEQLRNSPTLKRKREKSIKTFNSPEFQEFLKNYPPKKKNTANLKYTEKQLEQIRNSDYMKKRLKDAKRDVKSPEFKEFMKRNPLKRKQKE